MERESCQSREWIMVVKTELYWIEGPWAGRVAILPRPRGGDWLEDEVRAWRQAGIDTVISLLTPEEVNDFDLAKEAAVCQASGIEHLSFPIEDRSVPISRPAFLEMIRKLEKRLAEGKNIGIHCRQGIGRSSLVAVGLLVLSGLDTELALRRISDARGLRVPETAEQRKWLGEFARQLTTAVPKR
jgi:protein-tyrosine phosphatase